MPDVVVAVQELWQSVLRYRAQPVDQLVIADPPLGEVVRDDIDADPLADRIRIRPRQPAVLPFLGK